MDVSKDYYRILGVPPSSNIADIRRAYRVQAVRWHPDMHVGESPEMIRIAEYRFKEVNEAYSILSDPAQRSNYDYFRAKRATAARPQPGPQPKAQSNSQSWTHSRARTNAYAHAQQAQSQAKANAQRQQNNTTYTQSTQPGTGDFLKTTLQGFAIATAVLFYVVFPFSLVGGYWDTDAAARDISWKVGMEKQTVLMQSANWKEVEIHAVDLPEIILPKSYDDSIGLMMKAQFMMKDLKKISTNQQYQQDVFNTRE